MLSITVPAKFVEKLAELLIPKAGTYVLAEFPDVVFEVRRSEIKDAEGKIVEVIG